MSVLDSKGERIKQTRKKKDLFQFGDPKDYEHLSQEEREHLTQQMMGKHKIWAMKTPL